MRKSLIIKTGLIGTLAATGMLTWAAAKSPAAKPVLSAEKLTPATTTDLSMADADRPKILPQPLPLIRQLSDIDTYLEGPNIVFLADLPVSAQGQFLNSLQFDADGLSDYDRGLIDTHLTDEQARDLLAHFDQGDRLHAPTN